MIETRITLKEIAALANVSLGTVDRVIHGRGRVAPENRKRIESLLKEHNYQPNLLARSLSSKKSYKLMCLVPKYNEGEYWEAVKSGIARAQKEFSDYHVRVEFMYFNQYDRENYDLTSKELMSNEFLDGVIIAPLFKKESLILVEHLKSRRIPCVFIDSNIDSIEGVTYFGQHSFQGGLVAANLMATHLKSPSTILACRLHKDKFSESNQIENRMLGFITYFQSFCKDYKIVGIDLYTDNLNAFNKELNNAFSQHEDIRGMVTFNSKVFLLADYLQKKDISRVCLIGYDLLEENIKYLKDNIITNLIAQRPDEQGYLAIKSLVDQLMSGKMTSGKQYLPIDILDKFNIDFYE